MTKEEGNFINRQNLNEKIETLHWGHIPGFYRYT